jgi:hypothetical protein
MKGCACIYFLPGWENSYGAKIEKLVAEKNGMREIRFDPPLVAGGQGREYKDECEYEITNLGKFVLWFALAVFVCWTVCLLAIHFFSGCGK